MTNPPGYRFDDWPPAPLVCVCPMSHPDGIGQCVNCLRPFVGLWSSDRYLAAVEAYPELAGQTADWTLRAVTA